MRLSIFALFLVFATSVMADDQQGSIDIEIWQDGRKVEAVNDQYSLARRPFDIEIRFLQKLSVLVSASPKPYSFEMARMGRHVDDIPGFSTFAMAEGMHNDERYVAVSEESPGMWYYDDDADNRCNEINRYKQFSVCTRSIDNIFVQSSRKIVPIQDYTESTLYLVFISYENEPKTFKTIELDRDYMAISFK